MNTREEIVQLTKEFASDGALNEATSFYAAFAYITERMQAARKYQEYQKYLAA